MLHWLMLFSVADFPDQLSIGDLTTHGTIKSLASSSIAYSACSSFTALSGNSDLLLHSPSQTPAAHLEMEESRVDEGKKKSAENGSSKSDEKVEDGDNLNEEKEDHLESDEEDDGEVHREPIDHLLKVKIV